jgi:hypothetical protein
MNITNADKIILLLHSRLTFDDSRQHSQQDFITKT